MNARQRMHSLSYCAKPARIMGAAKALLSLPSLPEGGRCSALRGLVSLYRSLGVEDVVIVSGFHAEVVEAEALALGLSAVRNPDPQRGMGRPGRKKRGDTADISEC